MTVLLHRGTINVLLESNIYPGQTIFECFLGIVSLAYILYIEQTAKVGPKIVFPNSHKHIQSLIAAPLERKLESMPYLLFFTLYT